MERAMASDAQTVMIVDDEFFFREMLREVMVNGGFRVVAEASNGAEAVEKYRRHRPEITVMDIFMPELNGIDAIKEILSHDPAAKILIYTGMGFDEDVKVALETGARDVVLKNYLPQEVIEVMKRVLAEK